MQIASSRLSRDGPVGSTYCVRPGVSQMGHLMVSSPGWGGQVVYSAEWHGWVGSRACINGDASRMGRGVVYSPGWGGAVVYHPGRDLLSVAPAGAAFEVAVR